MIEQMRNNTCSWLYTFSWILLRNDTITTLIILQEMIIAQAIISASSVLQIPLVILIT